MSLLTTQPFSGTYAAQPLSTFAFAVRHSGVFWFRGSLSDVSATLSAERDSLRLDGSARVASISIQEPAAMRKSVLGPEFFDAENHPEMRFHSSAVELVDDRHAELAGELTIRGISQPIRAAGYYAPSRPSPYGEIAGLQLHTTFDRRLFGFGWQMEMPGGGDAVGWNVEVDIDLLLVRTSEPLA
jgi:polyisoprenoid-binding protein YceI